MKLYRKILHWFRCEFGEWYTYTREFARDDLGEIRRFKFQCRTCAVCGKVDRRKVLDV